jgi:hypothetical protein
MLKGVLVLEGKENLGDNHGTGVSDVLHKHASLNSHYKKLVHTFGSDVLGVAKWQGGTYYFVKIICSTVIGKLKKKIICTLLLNTRNILFFTGNSNNQSKDKIICITDL